MTALSSSIKTMQSVGTIPQLIHKKTEEGDEEEVKVQEVSIPEQDEEDDVLTF